MSKGGEDKSGIYVACLFPWSGKHYGVSGKAADFNPPKGSKSQTDSKFKRGGDGRRRGREQE